MVWFPEKTSRRYAEFGTFHQWNRPQFCDQQGSPDLRRSSSRADFPPVSGIIIIDACYKWEFLLTVVWSVCFFSRGKSFRLFRWQKNMFLCTWKSLKTFFPRRIVISSSGEDKDCCWVTRVLHFFFLGIFSISLQNCEKKKSSTADGFENDDEFESVNARQRRSISFSHPGAIHSTRRNSKSHYIRIWASNACN